MSDAMRGAIYGLGAAAIWGGMYVVSDVVLDIIPPFTLLSIRLLIGLLVLAFLLRRQGAPLPRGRELLLLIGVGVVGFGVSVGAQFVGTNLSSSINGSLITSAAPAFILIFAALILRERLTPRRVIAVALATIGVLIIIDPTQADFSSSTFAGDVTLFIAAITWGLYSVLVRLVSAGRDTLVVTTFAFIGGLLLTIPASPIELSSRSVDFAQIDAGVIAGILYLGVISTAVAMWMWNRAFALVDASVASLFFFAQPLVGATLSVALLGQAVTINLVIGGLLIALGVVLAILRTEGGTRYRFMQAFSKSEKVN